MYLDRKWTAGSELFDPLVIFSWLFLIDDSFVLEWAILGECYFLAARKYFPLNSALSFELSLFSSSYCSSASSSLFSLNKIASSS